MRKQARSPLIPVSDRPLWGRAAELSGPRIGSASPCNTLGQAGLGAEGFGIYFPITVAQAVQRGGEAEQQAHRNACVLANLGN